MDPEVHVNDAGVTAEEDAEELSEAQLRQLYDDEEIDRFLHLFAAHVTEVQLPDSSINKVLAGAINKNIETDPSAGGSTAPESTEQIGDAVDTERAQSLSERIAFKYVLPNLPPPPLPSPVFTLGRLRFTIQRVYLSILPVYGPFFKHLANLSTWKDRSRSARFCSVYWILWYYDLLLPALFLRIFYALIRRRLSVYPTVIELKKRRKQVDRANELGEEIATRLSTSSFGLKEIWRISRIFSKPKTANTRSSKKNKPVSDAMNNKVDDTTVLDDTTESQKETDMKRETLQALNEIADLHERIKNMFIWRKPESTRTYGMIIFFCFLLALLLPAHYMAKLVYFLIGFFFWHLVPVVAALPPRERSRLPPAFSDVPTDAEFAMEVISKRIAAGLDVDPSRVKRRKRYTASTPSNGDSVPGTPGSSKKDKDKDINWKKWGERAAIGKAWAVDKRILAGKDLTQTQNASSSPVVSQPAEPADETTQSSAESHTFPCQHTSAPGLLTLTKTMMFFTPITSPNPKVSIPFTQLRGVKKSGLLKGLTIKWVNLEDGEGDQERQEVFPWVGGRDEIFARMIGTDVKRWIQA